MIFLHWVSFYWGEITVLVHIYFFPAWTFWQHDDDEDGDDDGDDADTDSDVDDDGLKFLKTFGSEKFHSWKVWQRQQTNYSQ